MNERNDFNLFSIDHSYMGFRLRFIPVVSVCLCVSIVSFVFLSFFLTEIGCIVIDHLYWLCRWNWEKEKMIEYKEKRAWAERYWVWDGRHFVTYKKEFIDAKTLHSNHWRTLSINAFAGDWEQLFEFTSIFFFFFCGLEFTMQEVW